MVVGIGWVVECAEKRVRVDEERFKVDVASMNAASLNKVFIFCFLHLWCMSESWTEPEPTTVNDAETDSYEC